MSTKVQHLKVLARKIQSLPTLPKVVEKLMTMVESPDVSPKDVGKLISSDQVLGARVLRLVNSPFYGFPGRISSISHAIILLGFNVIKGVVLSASVFDLMERSMVGLWEHSLGSAIVSGAISRKLGLAEPEEISTAALLHDIGKVLVRVSLSADYDRIVDVVKTRQ
ncbi:MAG TPA: HDOD domain-containing protein, partial [Deltaproteobacteria bacterium]|nr:HDOD domain-containing protein [Deltaproteobacteria bacterium]